MTAEQFDQYWAAHYPETIPVSHQFKHDYADRWFRIHSLPESKRYADTDAEWEVLLSRQNTLLSDLLGGSAALYVVTGEYDYEGDDDVLALAAHSMLEGFNFTRLHPLDLDQLCPGEYVEGTIYRPMIAEANWREGGFDAILRSIANDDLRMFFMCLDKQRLVAPYDGGVDVILEDRPTRNRYRSKYQDWLSLHPKGL